MRYNDLKPRISDVTVKNAQSAAVSLESIWESRVVLLSMTKGFRQGSTAGDPWQQGGVFLIGPGEKLLFEHRDQFAGDLADLNGVLAAAE